MMNAYELAEKEIGVVEWKDGHNPKVVAYFKDAGHPQVKDDETAWCAAFVGAMLYRAGQLGTNKLTARSYLDWGVKVDRKDARPGDIVILKRGTSSWQGHVGFFVKDSGDSITILGGNQSNAVNRRAYKVDKDQLLGIRRAEEKPAAPAKKERKHPAQSTTVQASAVQIASGAGAGVAAVGALDGHAQTIVVVAAVIVVLAALWIMRERLKKWADGIR